jgi:hypothetical protein
MNRAKIWMHTTACIVLVATAVYSQPVSIKVDGGIIKGYILHMASDSQLGRRSLTPGYEKVADWVAAKFKEWGVKPAGENGTYFQAVPHKGDRTAFYWAAGVPELVIQGRPFYLKDNDFRVDPLSAPGAKAVGEIVFVGYGISAPSKGLDEYQGDVKGKIVLALKGSPSNAPAARGMFGPAAESRPAEKETDEWKEESADLRKATVAYEKGAAGILLYNPAPAPAFSASRPPRPEVTASPFARPFVYVNNIDERVFRWILSRDPQESARGFAARIDRMRRDIKAKKVQTMATGVRAQLKGYESVTAYGEKFKNNVSRNVLGKIEGVDADLKTQHIIVGAHLDHVGVTDGVIYNGADDNASGSAVAMEIARLMAQNNIRPKRTVIIGLWCGEELGLLGSRHYAANPADGVSMDRVVANFNLDMVGLGTRIGAPGALNFPEIWEVIKRDQDPELMKLVEARTGGPGGSDHTPFIEMGIESLALMTSGGGGHPDYHDSGDDPAKMEPDILGKTGQFVLQGTLSLANETGTNLLVPDRQHIYNAMRTDIPDLLGEKSGNWTFVKAKSQAELLGIAGERAKDLRKSAEPRPAVPAMMRMGRQSAAPFQTGIRDAWLFGGSVPLLEATATLIQFGRIDVPKDDRCWFDDGITDEGRDALKAMEGNNITLNLLNPYPKLLQDALQAATRPLMVTFTAGSPIQEKQMGLLKGKNHVVVIECSREDVEGCVNRLNGAKSMLGGPRDVVLSMSLPEKAEEVKRSLYLRLVRSGWTTEDISGIVGVGTGDNSRGNLTRLLGK